MIPTAGYRRLIYEPGVEADRLLEHFEATIQLTEVERQLLVDLQRQIDQASHETRFDDAQVAAESLAEQQVKHWGDRHPISLMTRVSIENLHLFQGRIADSQMQLDSLLSTLEQINPPDHPSTGDAGVHRRKGDRQPRGAAPRRRGLREPSQDWHAAAVRPDGDLRARARWPLQRQPDP